jgi:hypothetical protein
LCQRYSQGISVAIAHERTVQLSEERAQEFTAKGFCDSDILRTIARVSNRYPLRESLNAAAPTVRIVTHVNSSGHVHIPSRPQGFKFSVRFQAHNKMNYAAAYTITSCILLRLRSSGEACSALCFWSQEWRRKLYRSLCSALKSSTSGLVPGLQWTGARVHDKRWLKSCASAH